MRTVGQILKEERLRKYYTLEEVEKATKIRKELLQALEEDQYFKLPPPTFIQGFIKNYGRFLDLPVEKLLAVFRREFSDQKNPPRVLQSFTDPLSKRKFRMTPARFLTLLILGLIAVFFTYLWFEYRFLTGAPFLEVSQPLNQQNVEEEIMEVSGRTDPEAKVTVNNQQINIDISGKFTQQIRLTEGTNNILVTATSKSGKVSKVERTVFLR